MYVNVGQPSTDTDPIVYTVLVNGAAPGGGLTVSLAGNLSAGSDLTNSVSVTAGDLIDLQVTKANSVTPTVSEIMVTMEYV